MQQHVVDVDLFGQDQSQLLKNATGRNRPVTRGQNWAMLSPLRKERNGCPDWELALESGQKANQIFFFWLAEQRRFFYCVAHLVSSQAG